MLGRQGAEAQPERLGASDSHVEQRDASHGGQPASSSRPP